LEMHQVRYFLTVAQTLNFTKAAEVCNVSQPSLTRAIQKLEEELGGLMLHRERGNTHLTELGRLMLPFLEQTYASARSAKALAGRLREGEVAPLRIGVSPTLSSDIIVDVLGEVRDCVDGLELNLMRQSEESLSKQALAGEVDVLFLTDEHGLPERFRGWRLFSEKICVLTRDDHPAAAAGEIPLADLMKENIVENVLCTSRRDFRDFCESVGLSPNFKHKVDSIDEVQSMVQNGFGVGLVPSTITVREDLALLRIGEDRICRNVSINVVRGRPYSRATEVCVRLARSHGWEKRLANRRRTSRQPA
jgi:LysR family transcriptional regulator, hydrogen peroxide-inducible genes activator